MVNAVYCIIFSQQNRIDKFFLLQWVVFNLQPKNNKKQRNINLSERCAWSNDNKYCQLQHLVICHHFDDDFIFIKVYTQAMIN